MGTSMGASGVAEGSMGTTSLGWVVGMGVSVYTGMGVKVDVNVGMIGVNVKVNVGMTGVNVNVGDAVGVAEGSAVNVAVGVLDGLAFIVNSK